MPPAAQKTQRNPEASVVPARLATLMQGWLAATFEPAGPWRLNVLKQVRMWNGQRLIVKAVQDATGLAVVLKTNETAGRTRAEHDALQVMRQHMPETVTPLYLDSKARFFALEWIAAPLLFERFFGDGRAGAARDAGAWLGHLHRPMEGQSTGRKRDRSLGFGPLAGLGRFAAPRVRMRARLRALSGPAPRTVMLHGDFYPDNLFDTPSGLRAFDRVDDVYGAPYFDVAKFLVYMHARRQREKTIGAVAGSEESDRRAFFDGYGPIEAADLPVFDLTEDFILFKRWRGNTSKGDGRYEDEMARRGLIGGGAAALRPVRLVRLAPGEVVWKGGAAET